MILHQKRLIPKCWLTEQRNRENNLRYLSTLETNARVVFAGDSIIDYFPIDQLINKRSLNRGIAGYTSNQLLDNLDSLILNLNPQSVVISIGANDHYYRLEDVSTVNNIKGIVTRLITQNKDIRIVILALLPTDNRLDYKNDYFSHINKLVLDAVKDIKNVVVLNLEDKLKGPDGNCKQELFVDGLHPNARGYKIIADELNKII